MGFSIEQTLKASALEGVGGVRPVAVDTSRKNILRGAEEFPTPQAKKVLVDDRPDSRGLTGKVDVVA
jgi:hypothetical protein